MINNDKDFSENRRVSFNINRLSDFYRVFSGRFCVSGVHFRRLTDQKPSSVEGMQGRWITSSEDWFFPLIRLFIGLGFRGLPCSWRALKKGRARRPTLGCSWAAPQPQLSSGDKR